MLAVTIAGINGFDLQYTTSVSNSSFGYVQGSGVTPSNLNIVNRGAIITSVNGKSLDASQSSNLVWIVIRDQVVYFIQGLEIRNSSLKEVQQKDIAQFKKLKDLHLHGNHLEYLPEDLFEKNLDIVCLRFENNNLKSIGHNLLTPLTKLVGLQVSPNPCVDNGIPLQAGVSGKINTLRANCPEPTIPLKHPDPGSRQSKYSTEDCKQQLGEATAKNEHFEAQLESTL
jgi:hypothetical protein